MGLLVAGMAGISLSPRAVFGQDAQEQDAAVDPGLAPDPGDGAAMDPQPPGAASPQDEAPKEAPRFAEAALAGLPAYDVRLGAAPGLLRVGDSVSAEVAGFPAEQLKGGIRIEPNTPEDAMVGQGFDVQAPVAAQGTALAFTVVPLKPGPLVVPQLLVLDDQGKPIARLRSFTLQVAAEGSQNDPKANEPEPPLPPMRVRFPLLIAIAMALGALLLVVGLFYVMIRSSRKTPVSVAAPKLEAPKPEDEIALLALKRLEEQNLPEKSQFKLHYFAISEILKGYVGARYGFDAVESTTREMIGRLRDQRLLDDGVLSGFEEIFSRLDLVKFTDHVPGVEDARQALRDGRAFVERTRRPVRPEPILAQVPAGSPNAV